MRGFEVIAIVIGVFFVVGIAVGMLLVIVLPVLKSMLGNRRNRRLSDRNRWNLPPREDYDERLQRWPGG